jgi:hypothetical protein
MTTLREAAEAALDALVHGARVWDAIGILEAALRQPEPRREWRRLTEEEIVDIWAAVSEDYDDQINIIELARAIEQALKEKNDA